MTSVLEMSGKVGHRARAVKHVADVYKSVIFRPRFGVVEVKSSWEESHLPRTWVDFSVGSESFRLTCMGYVHSVSVSCVSLESEEDRTGWFRFTENHSYKSFGKLKKSALILMKKIEHKLVYDTMKA